MQTLTIDGKIRSGEIEKQFAWRACFAAIGQMPQLVHLHLDGHRVAVASNSLACWSGLTNLKTLCLFNFAAHDLPLLKRLPPLPHLEAADFAYSKIGDDDLPYLAALPSLKTLILNDTEITGAGLAALARSECLEELMISAEAASAVGFESLLAFKRLKRLHIDADRGRWPAYVPWEELVIGRGATIHVAATELERCGSALDALRQSKPDLIIDADCNALHWPWPVATAQSQGYEESDDTQEVALHELLREWKEQQRRSEEPPTVESQH